MIYNIEETAMCEYEQVLNYIKFLLTKNEKITKEFLQKHYFKLKKQEFRTLALGTIPLIKQMVCFSPLNSRIMPKIAQIMKQLNASYIDKDVLEFLTSNKDNFYNLHCKENYEDEAKTEITKNKNLDCLFEETI